MLGLTLGVSTGAPAFSVVGIAPVLTKGLGRMCGGWLSLKRDTVHDAQAHGLETVHSGQ